MQANYVVNLIKGSWQKAKGSRQLAVRNEELGVRSEGLSGVTRLTL